MQQRQDKTVQEADQTEESSIDYENTDESVGSDVPSSKWRSTIDDLRGVPVDDKGVWHT